MGSGWSDEERAWLVLRAQSGSRDALDDLLRSVQDSLFRHVVDLVGDETAAEDVLQEVLILIYRKLGFLRDPRLFRAWAFRIATREAWRRSRDRRRWYERFRGSEMLDTIASAEPLPSSREEIVERLPALLDAVSPASRVVLVLHYIRELTIDEIAAELRLSVGTVKSRLAYGLATLRQRLTSSP